MPPIKPSPILITLSLLLTPYHALGQVYKTINPDGSVTYTDQAIESAEPVHIAPIQLYSPPTTKTNKAKQPSQSATNQQPDTASNTPTVYTEFYIASPQHDSAIRANSGTLTLTLSLTPPLNIKQGDKIIISLDGQTVGKPSTQLSYTLTNLDRGSHTLSASLVNANGATIKVTDPITVHILKAHIKR